MYMTSLARRHRLEPRTPLLQVMLAVMPIIPLLPRPHMEIRIRAMYLHPHLRNQGLHQRTHTRLTNSQPHPGTIQLSQDTLLTQQQQARMHTVVKQHPQHPRTPLQVLQLPRPATTLLLMAVNIRFRNNRRLPGILNLVRPGTQVVGGNSS